MKISNKLKFNKIYLLLTLCVLFWSGNFIVGRYINTTIDPVQLAFFRWISVAFLLIPFLIKDFKNILSVFRQNFLILNILAILSVTAYNTLLYHGLQTTQATNGLLINSVVPVEILLLSFFILKIKIVFKQFLGILLSLCGVVFLVVKGDISLLKTLEFNIGDLWILSAGFVWALYSVLIKFKPQGLSILSFLSLLTYVGLFWLYLVYISCGYSITNDITLMQDNYLIIIYISVFTSILSYIFWNLGVEKIGANQTGQFTHLMPLFGSILAYLFLGEVLHLYHLVGAVIIMIGIYLSLFNQGK